MPKNIKTDLKEFNSSDGQSQTAEPHVAGSSARGADKSDGQTAIPDFGTRAEVMNQIMGSIHSMNKDQLASVFKGLNHPTDGGRAADKKDGEKEPLYLSPTSVRPAWDGMVHPTKSTVTDSGAEQDASNMRLSPTSVVTKEDMDDIFGGEELSEDMIERTRVVFEATVNSRLIAEMVRIEEENEAYLEEAVEAIRTELTEKVDEYLSYVAEEWVNENGVEIEAGLTNEMAVGVLEHLKTYFEDNYITVSEEKIDVVESLNDQLEEIKAKLNDTVSEVLELRKENESLKIAEAFEEITAGLSEMQISKLSTLSEGITYESVEDFTKKLGLVKETYLSDKKLKSTPEALSEEMDLETPDPKLHGVMEKYVETAVKHSKSAI